MQRRSAEIGEKDRRKYKEETVPDAVYDSKMIPVIGALVFGYYFGFILSRFYIQDDIQSIKLEIIRTGVLGAVFGSVIGGWMSDCFGRRFALLFADKLILVGGLLLVVFLSISDYVFDCYLVTTVMKTIIGFGVGMTSITSLSYILEVASTHPLKNLHIWNSTYFAVGKFIFFCIDTRVAAYSQDLNKTSDYILAMALFPALLQFLLMKSLPDSPIWLYKMNRKEDSIKAFGTFYTSREVEKELDAIRLSIKNETGGPDEKPYYDRNIFFRMRTTWNNSLERRQIVVGIGLQVAEQFVSENTLIYVFPRIIRMGGLIASPNPKWDIWYMKLTFLMCYGLNGIQSASLPYRIVKLSRRKILLIKSYCMMVCLLGLSFFIIISPNNIRGVSNKLETITYFGNNTCPSYTSAPDADAWNCFKCLQAGCGFCNGIDENFMRALIACLAVEPIGTSPSCFPEQGIWFAPDSVTRQCELKIPYGPAFILLIIGLVPYTFGLESHMRSRMSKVEVRGRLAGTVAATNWISFLLVIVSSFTINKDGGTLFLMLLISLISFFVTRLINLSYLWVPEMKGSSQSKVDTSKVS
ncbi:hypothetical protein C5167_044546 [Papaver somniferum]|uniref:Major facilitator superfamily (MFS) profile domain-containing protein n=1 Tax=Papaver somniferum TaxID=3469 RepID=A0A4Y7LBF7_PAPSO|nr:probable inositol transporter 2 [Papaver somniferum]RZC81970.1 hypothetical protein C5167_044546 [Papaver somniferum]